MTKKTMGLALFALSMTACTGNLDDFRDDAGVGAGADSGTTGTQGPQPLLVPADVLFVVDNSGSMAQSQARLADAFSSFVDQIAGQGDFRIGVVSTDLDSAGGERGGYVSISHDSSAPFTLLDIDTNACTSIPVDHGCFRGPSSNVGVIDANALSRSELITRFSDAVRLGTCGSGNEKGLDAMLLALAKDGCTGAPFIRAEANLIVVFVTDEEELSDRPISEIVTELARYKPLEQTRVAVLAGIVDGEASACAPQFGAACGGQCQTPPPASSGASCQPGRPTNTCPAGEYCDSSSRTCANIGQQYWNETNCGWCTFYAAADCCTALAGERYVEFARAFEVAASQADPTIEVVGCDGSGGRPVCLLESICQSSLDATLTRIARTLMLGLP